MITLIEETETTVRLEIVIPLNKTNAELLAIAKTEVPYLNKQCFQKHVKIASGFPPFIILYFAHAITHMALSVSLLVGEVYISCIEHEAIEWGN